MPVERVAGVPDQRRVVLLAGQCHRRGRPARGGEVAGDGHRRAAGIAEPVPVHPAVVRAVAVALRDVDADRAGRNRLAALDLVGGRLWAGYTAFGPRDEESGE